MFCHLWPESLWSGFRCVSDPLLIALQCSVLFSQEKKLSCDGKGIVGAGTRHPAMCPWQKGMKENKVGRITQAAAMLGEGLAWLWLVPTWACNCTKIKWFFPKIITFLSIPLQECLAWELEHIPLCLQPLEATMHCCRAGRLLQWHWAFVGNFAMYTTIIGMLCIPPMSPKCRRGSPQQQGLFDSAMGAKWWLQPIHMHPPLAAFIDPNWIKPQWSW